LASSASLRENEPGFNLAEAQGSQRCFQVGKYITHSAFSAPLREKKLTESRQDAEHAEVFWVKKLKLYELLGAFARENICLISGYYSQVLRGECIFLKQFQ
jgi:hypothetical protein